MTLIHTPIASLAAWSCSRDGHDTDDRLVIHTDWGDELVVLPYCRNQHDAGAFMLDPAFIPAPLTNWVHGDLATHGLMTREAVIFVHDSVETYGRGLFKLGFDAVAEGWSMEAQSAGTIRHIEAVSGRELRQRQEEITLIGDRFRFYTRSCGLTSTR